jgi:hypothetical protein
MAKENTPVNTTPSFEEIQARLAFLQLQELERQQIQRADEEAQKKQIRLAGALAAQEAHNKQVAHQKQCAHKKERGETACVGTRDGSQREIFICQRCQKEFTTETIPGDLRPNQNYIGGPSIGVI